MPSVLMYTTPTCVYCREAKEFFKEHNVEYEEKDVVQDEQARNDMIQKSGQMGIPVIDINGTIIVGFDRPRIDAALKQNS